MSKLTDLLYFRGNTWWGLPKSRSSGPNPPHEGPVGGTWLSDLWGAVTSRDKHATPPFYLAFAEILGIITLLEVWVFTIDDIGNWLTPIMIVLSLTKFVLVVSFFMHLRFDHRFYGIVFTFFMVLGVGLFVALLALTRHRGV